MTDITAPSDAITIPEQAARPDTSDMKAVHNVFRDALAAAPALINGIDDGDTARVALIATFYDNVLCSLEGHHQGEDELVFPLLLERCTDDADLVRRIAGQHDDVEADLSDARAQLGTWADADGSAKAALVDALTRLGATLGAHLDEEEREILPLCARVMTMPEWGALPAHAMRSFTGDKIWLIQGLIRQRMTQQQRDLMIAHMPAPVVEMWTSFGENAFNQLIAEVGPPLG